MTIGVSQPSIPRLLQSTPRRRMDEATGAHVDGPARLARHARQVATAWDTDHHELVVAPQSLDVIEQIAWHLDEPFGDTSAIPTYMVSKLASEHVKVVLSGDGGDEIFAGYNRYRYDRGMLGRLVRLPPSMRRGLAAGIWTFAVVVLLITPVVYLSAFVVAEISEGISFVRATLRSEGFSGLLERLPVPLASVIRALMRHPLRARGRPAPRCGSRSPQAGRPGCRRRPRARTVLPRGRARTTTARRADGSRRGTASATLRPHGRG